MPEYLSNKKRKQSIGINSYSEYTDTTKIIGNVLVGFGSVGVGTTVPTQDVDVNTIRVRDTLFDYTNSGGEFGYYLVKDTDGIKWVAVPPIDSNAIFVAENNNILGVSSFTGLNIIADELLGVTPNPINPNFADITILPRWLKSGDTGIYTTKNVGIGTTIPTTDFQVGFGTTGVTIDGSVGVVSALGYYGNYAFIDQITVNDQLNVVGLGSTLVAAFLASAGGITTTGGDLYVGGSLFADKLDIINLKVVNIEATGITTLNVGIVSTFRVTGVSTLGVTSTKDLFVDANLEVSGITTLGITSTKDLFVDENLYVVGIATATRFSTGATGSAINITSNIISGPAEIIIDPADIGDNSGIVRIKGDLYVDGEEFIVNSTTIELADFNVGIASTVGTNFLLDGAGIGIGSTNIRKTLTYDFSSDALKSSENFDLEPGKVYKINETEVLSSTQLTVANINATGVSTLGFATIGQLYVSGLSTFVGVGTFINDLYVGGDLYVADDIFFDELNAKNANITGITTLNVGIVSTFRVTGVSTLGVTSISQLYVSGLSTFVGVGTFINDLYVGEVLYADVVTGLTSTRDLLVDGNLRVTGITTLGITSISQLNVSGITTLGITSTTNLTSRQLNVSGITTLGITSTTNLTSQQLNVSGITTLGITTLQQLYVSGVSTFVGVGTFIDDLYVGKVLYAKTVDFDNIEVENIKATGITTLNVGIVSSLTVTGITTLGITSTTDLLVDGNLEVTGVSTFVGLSTFNNSVIIQDNLLVSGITTLAENGGITTTGGDLYVGGILYADTVSFDSIQVENIEATGISTLNVGIVSSLTVTGITTLGITSISQLNVSGITTLGITSTKDLFVDANLEVSGITTLGVTSISQLNVSGITTLGVTSTKDLFVDANLEVSGISTLGVTSTTNLTSQQLNVSGITTLGVTSTTNLTSQQLNVSGILTASRIVGTSLSISGISTIANFIITNVGTGATVGGIGVVTYYGDGSGLTKINSSAIVGVTTYADRAGIATNVIGGIASVSQLNVSGISTLGVTSTTNLTSQQLNVSGITTLASIVGTSLSISGISTLGVTSTTNLTSQQLLVTGITTLASIVGTSLSISGISTLGITSTTNLTSQQLNVSGILTASRIVGTSLSIAGISTIANFLMTPVGAGATVGGIGVTYYGDGRNLTSVVSASGYADNAGIATNLKGGAAGSVPYQLNPGITTFVDNPIVNDKVLIWKDGVPVWDSVSAGSITGTTEYADNAGIATYATNAGIATNLKGGLTGNIPYQLNPDITTFVDNSSATSTQVLRWSGSAPYWGSVDAGSITGVATYADRAGIADNVIGGIASVSQLNVSGITTLGITSTTNLTSQQLRVTGITTLANIVGTSLSITGISTIANFIMTPVGTGATVGGIGVVTYYGDGSGLTKINSSAIVGVATYADRAGITTNVIGGIGSITQLQVSGISTFTNGPILVGSATSTGTLLQRLQVTGGAYVSGNLGVGTTNPTSRLTVQGDVLVSGILTASRIVGTSLSITGISTIANFRITNVGTGATVGGIGVTYYGDGSQLINISSSSIVGIITYADNSGIATNVIGGIASVTSLNVTGISTLGSVEISSGIVTAKAGTGIVTYYGDGSKLSGVSAFSVQQQDIITSPVYPTFASNIGTSSLGIAATELVYIPASGNLGIGTTTPTSKLTVVGDVLISGVLTATRLYSGIYGEFVGGSISGSDIVGTSLSISGISTIANFLMTPVGTGATVGGIGVTYYGDGSQLINISSSSIVGIITYADNSGIATNVIGGIASVTSLNVSGISTLGVTSTTDLTAQQLNVTGITTLSSIVGTSLSITGISTIANFILSPVGTGATVGGIGVTYYGDGSQLINISSSSIVGIITYADNSGIATNVIGGIASVTSLNVTGITTLGITSISQLNVSGITTLTSIVGTSLSISGITTLGVTSTTNLTSQQLNVTGITTLRSIVGTSLSISGISTIANFIITNVGTGATVGGIGVVTYYGDGSGLTNINLSSVVGVVTYADRAGIATNVIGGIGSITQLQVSGISTFTNGPILIGSATSTGTSSQRLQVTGGAYVSGNLGIGTTTPTSKLTVVGDVLVSGVLTAASFSGTASTTFYTSEWILGANGSNDYTFTGPGFIGNELDPTLYVTRGERYKFTNTMNAHPFRIQSTPGTSGTPYNDGIVYNGVSNGTLTWDVRFNAPNVLYYQCTAHGPMVGKIYVVDAGIGTDISINTSGIITASSFVGDGSNLTGIISGLGGIGTAGGTVGTGITFLDFRGSGISSITVSSGIATITIPGASRSVNSYVAEEGDTSFAATYSVGYADVYLNGSKLSSPEDTTSVSPPEYTASNGTSIELTEGASAGDIVEIVSYLINITGGSSTPDISPVMMGMIF